MIANMIPVSVEFLPSELSVVKGAAALVEQDLECFIREATYALAHEIAPELALPMRFEFQRNGDRSPEVSWV